MAGVLDAPPKETERRSWLYVTLWTAVIWGTIPFARVLRRSIAEHAGQQVFVYATVLLVLIVGVFASRSLQARDLPRTAYLWLFGVIAVFAAYAYELRDIPEEAIHVSEYGMLSVLVYRALTHRIRDRSIYFMAVLVVSVTGMLDEYVQWAIPSRYFDLRDIRTNFIAGALAQVAIALGLRPQLVSNPPSMKSLGRLCFASAVALSVLAVSFLNTPECVASYASRTPLLSFLLDGESVMVDYGYRYEIEEIGVFQSRFTEEQLRCYDRERGSEVAEILDRYIGGKGYAAFLRTYSVPRDAYVHEAGVHLFRRNRHLERANVEEADRPGHAMVALRENRILEAFYSSAMAHSRHRWSEEARSYVDRHALDEDGYVSFVSRDLITQWSEGEVLLGFAAAIAAFLILGAGLERASARKGGR